MQALFGSAFSTPVNVEVSFTNVGDRKYRDVLAAASGLPHRVYIFSDGDDVCGDVKVGVGGGKRLDHVGVKVELKGVIEVSGDKGGAVHEFTSLVRELAAPGSMTGLQSYAFKFSKAELPHESYDGINAVCRYYIKATVGRTATLAHAAKEAEFTVQNPSRGALTAAAAGAPAGDALAASSSSAAAAAASTDTSVKLEVGIEDCLHIEFEYDATSLGLDDDVTGRVHFLLVRIRIKTMELALVRRETVGGGGGGSGGAGATLESETLTRFELMDGCPVRGEVIPIRMPLAGLDLTPTLNTGAGASGGGGGLFSVRYFLNLVLLDEEDRRYFKQQELVLHRREIETGAPTALAGAGKGAAATGGAS